MIDVDKLTCKCGYFKVINKDHCCFSCSVNNNHGPNCLKINNLKTYMDTNYCCLTNFHDINNHGPLCELFNQTEIIPVIVCIAKGEENYIEEFVLYHLSIGFNHIFIYDNEDKPKYYNLLHKYKDNITVIHFPCLDYKNKQMEALMDFQKKYINNMNITHVIHMDIDEYIVLKENNDIKEFIKKYIFSQGNNNNCAGIAINWKFFGSNINSDFKINAEKYNLTANNNIMRFTNCQESGHRLVKTLFNKSCLRFFYNPHIIAVKKNFFIKNTSNKNYDNFDFTFTFNHKTFDTSFIDTDIIQINHYKCKTFDEYKKIRTRGYASGSKYDYNNISPEFSNYDKNKDQDFTAYNYYLKNILNNQ